MADAPITEKTERIKELLARAKAKKGKQDFFLKVDGIEGESTDSKHGKEIVILGFDMGFSQTGTAGSGSGGAGAGKCQVQDPLFVARIDKAVAKLSLSCINGAHIKKSILTARKAGETPQDYLSVTFSDHIVSNFDLVDSDTEDAIPLMVFSFNYAQIELEYKEQKPDGSMGGSNKIGFNFAKMEKV